MMEREESPMRVSIRTVSRPLALPALLVVTLFTGVALADAPAAPQTSPDPSAKAQALIDKGVAFLKSQQKPDGSWQNKETDPPAITAIALRALVNSGKLDAN